MRSSQPSRAAADHYGQPRHTARPSGTLGGLLGQLPATVKHASTLQKVVGGALLAFGMGLWLSRKDGRKSTAAAAPADTLHELLLFVNDRVAGYERAVEHSQDAELRGYYQQLVSQSQQFANQLNSYLTREGSDRETGTTIKGKLYRAWMDIKATLTGHDEQAILNANIYGEEWALKAYEEALNDSGLTGTMRQEVQRQQTTSQATYQHLRKLAEESRQAS